MRTPRAPGAIRSSEPGPARTPAKTGPRTSSCECRRRVGGTGAGLWQARERYLHDTKAASVQRAEVLEAAADVYNPTAPGANAVMLGSPGTASLATGAVLKEGYLFKVVTRAPPQRRSPSVCARAHSHVDRPGRKRTRGGGGPSRHAQSSARPSA